MKINKEKQKKSLLFVIEDVAKLLRTEARKAQPLSKSVSLHFVNNVEQIAKLLRSQVRLSPPKKKRAFSHIKKHTKK